MSCQKSKRISLKKKMRYLYLSGLIALHTVVNVNFIDGLMGDSVENSVAWLIDAFEILMGDHCFVVLGVENGLQIVSSM